MKKNFQFISKVILLLFTSYFLLPTSSAQAPQKMSYQAVIRNTSDVLVKNQAVGMQITVLQGSEPGTPVYVETQTPTTNSNGLVSIDIGGGTPVTGTFSSINWASGTYYLKTEIDPAGQANYTITGISQILSVPYALNAKKAETASSVICQNKFVYQVTFYGVEYENVSYEYWTANNDGTGKQKITFPASFDDNPDEEAFQLTPDRQTLIYAAESSEDLVSVYSVSIDGTNFRKLFDAPAPLVIGGHTYISIIATY